MSEETLEKFIEMGFINEFSDIYHLENHEEEIVQMKGFGRSLYYNLCFRQ
jgi:DNA ligase (NAD+)